MLLILAIGACFTGALNSIREIVKEQSIYTRERAAGLSAGAYLWSKLLVLGALSAVQAALMTVVGLIGRPLPPHGSVFPNAVVELVLAMAVLAIASMTIGLMISAVVRTSETTLVLLFISVMLQIVLTGGVIPIAGKVGVEQLAWISPSRWGFGAVASTDEPQHAPAGSEARSAVDARPRAPGCGTWACMVLLAVVFASITYLAASKPGPSRGRPG